MTHTILGLSCNGHQPQQYWMQNLPSMTGIQWAMSNKAEMALAWEQWNLPGYPNWTPAPDSEGGAPPRSSSQVCQSNITCQARLLYKVGGHWEEENHMEWTVEYQVKQVKLHQSHIWYPALSHKHKSLTGRSSLSPVCSAGTFESTSRVVTRPA